MIKNPSSHTSKSAHCPLACALPRLRHIRAPPTISDPPSLKNKNRAFCTDLQAHRLKPNHPSITPTCSSAQTLSWLGLQRSPPMSPRLPSQRSPSMAPAPHLIHAPPTIAEICGHTMHHSPSVPPPRQNA